MKFIISSSILLKQLSSLSGLFGSGGVLPVLENVLFELDKSNLKLSATDLETSMSITVNAESTDRGSVAIPGKLLLDTLKTFPDQPLTFSIDLKKSAVEILTDSGKYKLVGHQEGDFPNPAQLEKPSSIEMDSETLIRAIDHTLFAVSNDELRPMMCGVFININSDRTVFVSTDAHKLVRYTRDDIKSKSEASYIIPKKPLSLLKALLGQNKVKIEHNATNVSFDFAGVSIVTKLIDAKYPNYEAVIPKENVNKLIISRLELLSSIRRVAVFSNRNTHQVKLSIKSKSMAITAEDLDFSNEAAESIKCDYNGQPMEIGFNSKFLVEILSCIDTDEVMIELGSPNKAGLIRPVTEDKKSKEDILMIVMPVMIN